MSFLNKYVLNNDIILIKCSNATEINNLAKDLLKKRIINLIKYLAFEFQTIYSFLNVFSYITFRSGAAILTGLFFSLILEII